MKSQFLSGCSVRLYIRKISLSLGETPCDEVNILVEAPVPLPPAVVMAGILAGTPFSSAEYAEQYSLYLVVATAMSGASHIPSLATQLLR